MQSPSVSGNCWRPAHSTMLVATQFILVNHADDASKLELIVEQVRRVWLRRPRLPEMRGGLRRYQPHRL
jgi:hypothetical protein